MHKFQAKLHVDIDSAGEANFCFKPSYKFSDQEALFQKHQLHFE